MLMRMNLRGAAKLAMQQNSQLLLQSSVLTQTRLFTGKTESGYKYLTPKLRMKNVRPVYPPPGLSLRAPEELDVETFMRQIGGDCEEYAEKFETMEEVLTATSNNIKHRGVPTVQRKYLLRCRELLRRGLLTFEYLNRRTCLDKCRKA